MKPRSLTLTLVKLIPLYVLFMILWQATPLSRFYGEVVAGVISAAYRLFDPDGPGKGVVTRGGSFFVKLLIGKRRVGLDIVAADITSNTALLLALYAASPFTKTAKRFAVYLAISLGVMISIHVVTLAANIQYALMTRPEIMRLFPPGNLTRELVPIYKNFYEIIGMYLFALLLWLPYLLGLLPAIARRSRRAPPLGPKKS